jgi:hypothetical protein
MRNNPNARQRQPYEQEITHDDIRNLLLAYCGAIALDQIRVDALPPASFHREYSRGMWLRYRRRHLHFISRLLATSERIPTRQLGKLTGLATARKPAVVREAMVELLSLAATDSLSPGQIDTASLFFRALIEHVGKGSFLAAGGGDCSSRIKQWLVEPDPLSIAEDPECGYFDELQCHVEEGK